MSTDVLQSFMYRCKPRGPRSTRRLLIVFQNSYPVRRRPVRCRSACGRTRLGAAGAPDRRFIAVPGNRRSSNSLISRDRFARRQPNLNSYVSGRTHVAVESTGSVRSPSREIRSASPVSFSCSRQNLRVVNLKLDLFELVLRIRPRVSRP